MTLSSSKHTYNNLRLNILTVNKDDNIHKGESQQISKVHNI